MKFVTHGAMAWTPLLLVGQFGKNAISAYCCDGLSFLHLKRLTNGLDFADENVVNEPFRILM